MTVIRGAVLGLVVLVASTGCATVARSGANGGHGSASPITYEVERCEGWYNAAAGVCDSIGD
jgi:hypothetical protein